MLYRKIENRDFNKKIPIGYVGYIPAPFGPSKTPHVVFVKATDEDVRKEYDSRVDKQLKEESNHIWNKKKGRWEIRK